MEWGKSGGLYIQIFENDSDFYMIVRSISPTVQHLVLFAREVCIWPDRLLLNYRTETANVCLPLPRTLMSDPNLFSGPRASRCSHDAGTEMHLTWLLSWSLR